MTAISDPDLALRDAQKAIQSGDFATARQITDALLAGEPTHKEALYMAAVCARYEGRSADALAHLDALKSLSPDFGRAYQEEGHLKRKLGDLSGAVGAFERATRYNPALMASWSALADLYHQAGNTDAATNARAQADRVRALPRELQAVTNHIHEGRVFRAEEIARAFLQKHPTHVEGMRLLADIGSRLGVQEDAEFLLESAVDLDPDNVQLRLDYIQVLRKRQKFAAALEQAGVLMARDPDNPLFQSHLAIESMQTGDYDRAFTLFDAVLEKLPQDPATLTSRGHAHKTTGAQDDAIASYRAAIAARPDHGDAWYALANLKTYRFSEEEIAALRGHAGRPDLAFADRVYLSFALGKAMEDRENYADSFAAYREGNDLKRAQTRYSADAMSAELARQREACEAPLFERHAGDGHDAPDPIFVLGLPRAGSTLLEQILASHSQIDGTLELPNILALAHRLRGRKAGAPRYPQVLHELTDEQLRQFGKQYIEDTRIHRQGAPFFIDKMPNNFRHIGLIHLILPNSKIIDARRAPMDCCFSGFKQLFAEGQEFTYGLAEIGRYYRDYVDLMAHWDEVLPGKGLRVQHEDVLDDLEGQTRRMLDFIGVPFEEQCLTFHKTERAVRTASSEQVRRPLNRSGQDAWKNYEPWLDDLKSALSGEAS